MSLSKHYEDPTNAPKGMRGYQYTDIGRYLKNCVYFQQNNHHLENDKMSAEDRDNLLSVSVKLLHLIRRNMQMEASVGMLLIGRTVKGRLIDCMEECKIDLLLPRDLIEVLMEENEPLPVIVLKNGKIQWFKHSDVQQVPAGQV